MYPNFLFEMGKARITMTDIARITGQERFRLNRWFNEDAQIPLDIAIYLNQIFFPDKKVDYLFKFVTQEEMHKTFNEVKEAAIERAKKPEIQEGLQKAIARNIRNRNKALKMWEGRRKREKVNAAETK